MLKFVIPFLLMVVLVGMLVYNYKQWKLKTIKTMVAVMSATAVSVVIVGVAWFFLGSI